MSTDLLDEWLQKRYARILDHYPWKGLEVETVLQSTAAYLTGSVSVVQGSTAVTGTGTTFTTQMSGLKFRAQGDAAVYTFTYVGATAGTLDRNYEGLTNATAGFWIYQDEYTLPADAKHVLTVLDPSTGLPLLDLSKKGALEAAPTGWSTDPSNPPGDPGYPRAWATAADTAEASPPVLHVIQLTPAPLLSQGFPLRYIKAAQGFTGENTSSGPLPWIPDAAILEGARADVQLHLKDFTAAEGYQVQFQADLVEMVRLDGLRRGRPELRMAQRLVRYRMRRVAR